MAKKSSSKRDSKAGNRNRSAADKKTGTSVVRASAGSGGGSRGSESGMGDAFIKLLQSPLVAELVAVAATAALAALAEHGVTGGATRGKRAGKAVKEAGKAAAAAVGRRLGTEIDEIRKAASKSGARA